MLVSRAIGLPVEVTIILPDLESLRHTLPGFTRKSRTATESIEPPVGQMSYTLIYTCFFRFAIGLLWFLNEEGAYQSLVFTEYILIAITPSL
jgi:hypothetical protein